MSEIEELRARAVRLGIKVDKRWSADTLTRKIGEASITAEGDVQVADEPVASSMEPVDDGWPQRIAPCAWLDQDGGRWTDMGLAFEAAQRIRERG